MRATGARLVWAATTPVPEGKLSPRRRRGDEVLYNRAALRVMTENGVAVDDLHSFVLSREEPIQLPANVHFTPAGYRQLGSQVAVAILGALPQGREAAPYNPPKVVAAPAPEGEPLSTDFTVEVGGVNVPVYTARVNDPPIDQLDHGGSYSFASFDFSGPVTVKIRSPRMLQSSRIRPLSRGLKHALIDGYTTTFTLDKPAQLSFEPAGKRNPLLIFANALETDAPKPGSPGVVYFGPGIHRPPEGLIRLTSGQTLYLAAGAVVQAAVLVENSNNVTIRGRGILCGNSWSWLQGPAPRMIDLRASKNIRIEGIVLRGPYAWTVAPQGCENVAITGIKICGSRVWNDDGIDVNNSRHVQIRDSFIRTDDDCISFKGLEREWGDIDDVLVENCVLWCDRARILLFGHGSRATYSRNIVCRDLDVIHFVRGIVMEPGEELVLEKVRVENLRIEGIGQSELLTVRPMINHYMRTKAPGHIRDILFRDIAVTGAPGRYAILLENWDEKHGVRDVVLDNVTVNGQAVDAAWPNLRVEKGAEVRFGPR
jgi:hypothetical protein